jgi:hypothetical protein
MNPELQGPVDPRSGAPSFLVKPDRRPAILQRLLAEVERFPDTVLTVEDVCRRWGLEAITSRTLLDLLVDTSFLQRRSDGAYLAARSPLAPL